ncbi:MAG TPA: TetR family transcriptional regulator C-terminal domain-containing protein [Rhodocyclaceae bacterium]|jgi:TetR/AcrR family transcriptional repressor of nem operon
MDAIPASPTPPRRGRPPRSGPTQADTRTLLIQIGTEILSERGFDTTGIDTVLKRAQVPKGSFYYYFASKEDFGLAIIDNYAAYFAKRLACIFGDSGLTPRAQLETFIDSGIAGLEKYNFQRGCLVGNLGQEMASLNETFRLRLEAIMAEWEAVVEACLRAGQNTGEFDPALDAATASRFFWLSWEGAVLRAKLAKSALPIKDFRLMVMSQLQADIHAQSV